MKQEFDYFQKDGQWFPIIDVTLQHSRQSITTKALIDSGASFSVFQSEIAEYLGITIEQGKKIYLTGIGGRILGYVHRVSLSVGSVHFNCTVVFSPELSVSLNLLGRNNFFHPFVISFFEQKKKTVLSHNR